MGLKFKNSLLVIKKNCELSIIKLIDINNKTQSIIIENNLNEKLNISFDAKEVT